MKISLMHISKSYQPAAGADVDALREVTTTFTSGHVTAIVGPSGAGKSTLLHVIGLMDRPTHGSVLFDDFDCSVLSEARKADFRRKKIGFLFQMHYLLPDFTVFENVLLPLWDERSKHTDRVKELLTQLGIKERMHHLPHELSGGEQQRAALARALINEPEVLLADEPTGNLDTVTGSRVQDLMFEECRKRKMTVVLVTHHEALAKKADRIVTLSDGAITEDTCNENLS
jgi:lipoprotein-releasing system ATP-binding protein